MNKILVGLVGITLLISLTSIVHADGVVIPMSIKVEAFKEEMKKSGMDLYGRDDSDGEVENKGTSIKVITYKPVSIEQMDLMTKAAVKTVRK